jgi:hypothetical protein
MMARIQDLAMFEDIFTYDEEELHENQVDCWMVGNAIFLRDFGCFSENDEVACLTVDFAGGKLTETDAETGDVLRQMSIKVMPK